MTELGQTIERARAARGLSQEEFARLMGVAQPTISSWEAGTSRPKPRRFPLMSEVLDISVEELRRAYFADDEALERQVRRHDSEIRSVLDRMDRLEAVIHRLGRRRPGPA